MQQYDTKLIVRPTYNVLREPFQRQMRLYLINKSIKGRRLAKSVSCIWSVWPVVYGVQVRSRQKGKKTNTRMEADF